MLYSSSVIHRKLLARRGGSISFYTKSSSSSFFFFYLMMYNGIRIRRKKRGDTTLWLHKLLPCENASLGFKQEKEDKFSTCVILCLSLTEMRKKCFLATARFCARSSFQFFFWIFAWWRHHLSCTIFLSLSLSLCRWLGPISTGGHLTRDE
jgi:hypothetical protein